MPLNSILVEGSTLSVVSFSPATSFSPDRASFSLNCGPDVPAIPILTEGPLACRCRPLAPGTRLRLVGRLHHDAEATARTGRFTLVVLAEHLELAPVPASHRTEVA